MSLFGLITVLALLLASPAQVVLAQDPGTETSTATLEPSNTDTEVPSDTPAATETPTPTVDFSPTSSETATPTLDLLITPTPTATETPTATVTGTLTETPTPTATGSLTETPSETPSATAALDCLAAAPEYAELCAEAAAGPLRVVVELDMQYRPVAQLSNSGEAAQEAAIEDNQNELEEEMVVAAAEAEAEIEPILEFETVPYVVYAVDEAGLAELAQSDLVADIFADTPRSVSLEFSIPLIGADDAWNIGFTGAGQTIVILDTGIQKSHPMITAAKVVAEACFSEPVAFGPSYPDSLDIQSLCPGGAASSTAVNSGLNCTFSDDCYHGTHVAGIAAGDNGTLRGVAPDANLISIQVFSRHNDDFWCGAGQSPCALAWDTDMTYALEYVYNNLIHNYDIASINMSIGGGLFSTYCNNEFLPMTTVINNLRTEGVPTIIAAGNNGATSQISFPACISSAISVGATDDFDEIAGFSNRASILSLYAPGVNINSSIPTNGYASWNGTSMAAPHVAGAWALMKEFKPNISVTDALSFFQSSGQPIAASKRRINVYNAILAASPLPGVPVLAAPLSTTYSTINTPTFSWNASADGNTYEIQIDNNANMGTPEQTFTGSAGVLNYTASALPDGVYYWRVRGINVYGRIGNWSNTFYVTVDTIAPLAPVITLPADNLVSRGAPLHKWTAPATASQYQLQYDELAEGDFLTPVYDNGSVTGITFTPNFQTLGNFIWRMRARDLAGNWSPWTTPSRNLQIIAPLPLAPTLTLPATGLLTNDNTPDFSWAAIAWGDTYEIQFANNAAFTIGVQSFTGASGVLTSTPTLADGLWYWRVRANNLNVPPEPGAWSVARNLTVDTMPPAAPAPSKPVDNNIEITTVPKLEWLAALTATQYQVQLSDVNDFSNLLVDQNTATALTYTLTTAQALDFETIYWHVRARDAAGNWGAYSAARTFTVSLLNAPTNGFFTTDTTPLLKWLARPGALNYNMQVDNNSDFSSPEQDTTLNALSIHLEDLPLGLYYWRVAVEISPSVWSSWMAPWTFTVSSIPPSAAAQVTPANAALTNDNTPDFSWGAATNGDTYEIQIDNLNTFVSPEQDVTGGTGVLNYTATTLSDGLWYWRVRAKNIFGSPGVWSAARTLTVDTTGPAAPVITLPTDNFISRNMAVLHKWTAAATATLYQIQIDEDAGDFSLPVYDSGPFAGVTKTPPLQPLGSYDWRLRAQDPAGNWGPWTTTRNLNIIQPLPLAPVQASPASGLLTSDNTPDFVWAAITWGDTYQIQIDNNSNFASPEKDVTGGSGVLAYTVDTPLPDALYYWRVRAWNSNSPAEPGAWSASRFFTVDTTAPLAPVITLPADAFISRNMTVFHKWTAAIGATQYQIQYDEAVEGDFATPTYESPWFPEVSKTLPLQPIGSYVWHLRARDAAGNVGAWTAARAFNIIYAVPAAPALTSPATGLVTNDPTPDFNWTAIANGNTYQIQIASNSTFTTLVQDVTGTAGVLNYTATSLTDGLYYWRVRAYNANSVPEFGAWSAVRNFTVDTVAPGAPVLTLPADASNSVGTPMFTWTNPGGVTAYQLQIDNNGENFTSVEFDSGVINVMTLKPTLAQFTGLGVFEWRVSARDAAGNWSAWNSRTVTLTTPLPAAPTQTGPASGLVTSDNTVALSFSGVPYGVSYRVQIATNASFTLNAQMLDPFTSGSETSALADGLWYWRVSALNGAAQQGAWSAARTLTVDTLAPAPPVISKPTNNFNSVSVAVAHKWAASAGATQYQLQYDESADGGSFTTPTYDSGWIAGVTVTPPAQPLGSYLWRVRARDAAGNEGAWITPFTLSFIAPVPAAPVQTSPATASVFNITQPVITFNNAANGVSYRLQIATNNTFTTIVEDNSSFLSGSTTATVFSDGLYYWRVSATNSTGQQGAWSATRYFTVDTTPPAAPALMSPVDGFDSRGATLHQWASAPTATGYMVTYALDSGMTSITYNSATLTTTSFTVPAQSLGTYYWAVRSRDLAGNWSAYSTTRTVDIIRPIPTAPLLSSPVTGLLTNNNAPVFAWQEPSNSAGASYEIQFATNATFTLNQQTFVIGSGIVNYDSTPTPFITDGLFYWRVRAVNLNTPAEPGAWSLVRSFTVDTISPLTPVISAPADNYAARNVAVAHTWTAAATATQYQIQYDEDGGDFSSPVYDSGWFTGVTKTPPLQPLGSYDWRLRGRDAAGNVSGWTVTRSLDIIRPIPAAPVLSSPATALLTSDPSPAFAWAAAANGNTYQIQIASNNTFTTVVRDVTGGAGVLNYTASPDLADGLYYWRVRAFNANAAPESGAWSLVRNFTVDATPPSAPTLSAPVDAAVSVGAPTFTWANPGGATQYQLQLDEDGGDFSTPVFDSGPTTLMSLKPTVAQFSGQGDFDWQVRARDAAGNWGAYSAVRSITINPPVPPSVPLLISPATGFVTNDNTVDFVWTDVPYGDHFEIWIDIQKTFTSPHDDEFVGALGAENLTYTSDPLPDGTYYWWVWGYNTLNQHSAAWSLVRSFTVDTTAPIAPLITAPADNFNSRNAAIVHTWGAVAGATQYQIQVDEDGGDWSTPLYDSGWFTGTTKTGPLQALGSYDWRLRARDAAGNEGVWTTVRGFNVIQPLTLAPIQNMPAANALTNDNTPFFSWATVLWGNTFQIQIDNNSNFASPERDATLGVGVLSYISTNLPDGTYYWRVRAWNSNNPAEPGAWSATRKLTIGNYP